MPKGLVIMLTFAAGAVVGSNWPSNKSAAFPPASSWVLQPPRTVPAQEKVNFWDIRHPKITVTETIKDMPEVDYVDILIDASKISPSSLVFGAGVNGQPNTSKALAAVTGNPSADEGLTLPQGPPPGTYPPELTGFGRGRRRISPKNLELSDLGCLKCQAEKFDFLEDYATCFAFYVPKAQLWELPPQQESGCELARKFGTPEALILPIVIVYSPDVATEHETLVIATEWKMSERLWLGDQFVGSVIRYVYRPGLTYRTYYVEPNGKKSSPPPPLRSGPQLGIGIVF